MKNIATLFCEQVSLTLKAAMQRKAELTAKKPSEIGSTLQKYQKMLDQLGDDIEDNEKEIKNLDKVFVKAAVASPEKIKEEISKSYSAFFNAKENLAKSESLLVQLKRDFGDNKAASGMIKQALEYKKHCEKTQEALEKKLNDIVQKRVPYELTTHTDFISNLLYWLEQEELPKIKDYVKERNKEIKEENKSAGKGGKKALLPIPNIDYKDSKYIANVGHNDSLCWARYIPITNFPTPNGDMIKLIYLVIRITIYSYDSEGGHVVALKKPDFRGVEYDHKSGYSIAMTNKYADPTGPISNIFYNVTTLKEAKEVISYFASDNNLYGFSLRTKPMSPKERLEKDKDSFHILTKKGVKITADEKQPNFLTVKIPDKLVDTKLQSDGSWKGATQSEVKRSKSETIIPTYMTQFDWDLWEDLHRYIGRPMNWATGIVLGRRYVDFVKVEKKEEKGKHYTYFTVRTNTRTSLIDNLKKQKAEQAKRNKRGEVANLDLTPTEKDNVTLDEWLHTFKRVAQENMNLDKGLLSDERY